MFRLYKGDCLEVMKSIPDGSVDAIICDLPYGTTACKWDSVIPFEPLWAHYKRIVKKNGAIVLFGSQPFTSVLVASNLLLFKYCWVWEKTRPSNFFAAKFVPLNNTEDIAVFSGGGTNNGTKDPMCYYPQGVVSINRVAKNSNTGGKIGATHKTTLNDRGAYHQTASGYPLKTLKFDNDKDTVHPTQKPVLLNEYLVKTYTNPGEVVLDNTMGSGTCGVACANTGRRFIGIEMNDYYEAAEQRIIKAYNDNLWS